jgi:hypothetical protein
MDTNWAAEHLQTIRTLMERSALYRRALAPIMLCAGAAAGRQGPRTVLVPADAPGRTVSASAARCRDVHRSGVRPGGRRRGRDPAPLIAVGAVLRLRATRGGFLHAERHQAVWGVLVAGACGLLCATVLAQKSLPLNPHLLMGFFFGALHLAYGVYLHLTEKGKNAA